MNENNPIIYKEKLVREINALFGDRVVCLLSYGSIENNRANQSSDIDLFLLLDKYHPKDTKKINQIPKIGKIFDISIQYKDELPRMPYLYHDRDKACLSLTYLSSATTLLGTNIFVDIFRSLPLSQLRQSIFLTVSYYIDKVREKQIHESDTNNIDKYAKKYFARSIVDMLIFFEKTDMTNYKQLEYSEIMTLAEKKNLFPASFFHGVSHYESIVVKMLSIKKLMQNEIDKNVNEFELDEYKSTDGLVMPLLVAQDTQNTVVIYIHGNGSASCVSRPKFSNRFYDGIKTGQCDLLLTNNRGSNYITQLKKITNESQEKVFYGMTYELIKDCVQDIDGMIAYALERGYKKIYLMGHSSGANKICVYDHYKTNKPKELSGYVLCAGGDDIGLRKALISGKYKESLLAIEEAIRAGKARDFVPDEIYPSRHPISYQSLLELIKEDSDYDIFPYYSLNAPEINSSKFKYLKSIKLSTLIVYGDQDFGCGMPVEKALEKLSSDVLPMKNNLKTRIIKDADHNFTNQETKLGRIVAEWCKSNN